MKGDVRVGMSGVEGEGCCGGRWVVCREMGGVKGDVRVGMSGVEGDGWCEGRWVV